MAPSAAQAATAEALRQNQERIEELETIVQELQETIRNGPRIVPSERGESPPASIAMTSMSTAFDIPDAKVQLPDPFTGKSSEYAAFMAQCNLVFAARPREYSTNESSPSASFYSLDSSLQ